MLKIKDNVDLKELEKFGFKGSPEHYKMYYLDNTLGSSVCMINIYTLTRKIQVVESFYSEAWVEVLFDLINAGLVEKVEND